MECSTCPFLEVNEEIFCPVIKDYAGYLECRATAEDIIEYEENLAQEFVYKMSSVKKLRNI